MGDNNMDLFKYIFGKEENLKQLYEFVGGKYQIIKNFDIYAILENTKDIGDIVIKDEENLIHIVDIFSKGVDTSLVRTYVYNSYITGENLTPKLYVIAHRGSNLEKIQQLKNVNLGVEPIIIYVENNKKYAGVISDYIFMISKLEENKKAGKSLIKNFEETKNKCIENNIFIKYFEDEKFKSLVLRFAKNM